MRFLSLLSLLFVTVPAAVSACEGDCIVGITNAFLSNYTAPVNAVWTDIARQISDDLIPGHPDIQTTLGYLQPIISAYKKQAYQGMETAIFPNYFHGKCLDSDGVEPDGCPNPDCPIVCGTPGSLVHYYPKLRWIAYNQTYHLLQALATPGTETYRQVEQAVMDAAASNHGDRRRSYSRIYPRVLSDAVNVGHNNKASHSGSGTGSGSPSAGSDSVPVSRPTGSSRSVSPSKVLVPVFLKRAQDVQKGLKSVMEQVHGLLGEACGADGTEATNRLPDCSWEKEMKEYILSFP
ncbi:hypothetical protein GY45DRAFT_1308512 [Cubamyces sp. BRFM 1775]|nr:hypothetical protein GY45DRAFT_1308512 [Cubamyces sp. BRFM 1775]